MKLKFTDGQVIQSNTRALDVYTVIRSEARMLHPDTLELVGGYAVSDNQSQIYFFPYDACHDRFHSLWQAKSGPAESQGQQAWDDKVSSPDQVDLDSKRSAKRENAGQTGEPA